MEGVSGFIARAYESMEDLEPAHSEANCTSNLTVSECTIEGLEASTSYTITVAAFKKLQDDLPTIYGDASIAVHIKTGKGQHTLGRVDYVHLNGLNGSINDRSPQFGLSRQKGTTLLTPRHTWNAFSELSQSWMRELLEAFKSWLLLLF